MIGSTTLPDRAARAAAIAERDRNVLIDAGAGTGKTAAIVERMLQMLAPADAPPKVRIDRLAAITFTRKAAGELRLRVRERLLDALAHEPSGSPRIPLLAQALDGLDTAFIGTIHSFSDRLLRLRPVEAQLSPSYEVAEDEEDLVDETVQWLLRAVDDGALAREVDGTGLEEAAGVADAAIRAAYEADLLARTRELEFVDQYGIDALVRGFIRYRDVAPPRAPLQPLDRARASAAIAALMADLDPVTAVSDGGRRLSRLREGMRDVASQLAGVGAEGAAAAADEATAALFGTVRRLFDAVPKDLKKGKDFHGDPAGWHAWKALPAHRVAIQRPFADWLSAKLLHVAPVAVALYERVKARRKVLDQLDLLEKLRNLLARDAASRAFYQGLFDHIFVDEFQDTDPLQAEIVLFLCEQGTCATHWHEVAVAPGRLTIVGDPKQSIYRFRRADIEMYDSVRRQVLGAGAALEVQLETNLRSATSLVRWFNDRFARVLGTPAAGGAAFDINSGRVYYSPLLPLEDIDARDAASASGTVRDVAAGRAPHGVRVLPVDFADGGRHKVDEYRSLEARAIAAYIRHLVTSGVEVRDPYGSGRRPLRLGDVAILTVSTYGIRPLFDALDEAGIPYTSRGGTLLLGDPLHRRFLLGLRALSDRDDGVALAALMRPPFFAIDPADVLAARAVRDGWDHPDAVARSAKVAEAETIVRALRQARFDRSPGATARDLLEQTAFARVVALGPNGRQRLARLRFLACEIDLLANREGLDFDAVTARARTWVERPLHLDPPHAVDATAVQVLTIHQAKGLEFPVVVWWDGRGTWDVRLQPEPWRISRDGREWVMALHGFTYATDPALEQRERAYLREERRRLVYVAATRARDLLVLPRTGTPKDGLICAELLAPPVGEGVTVEEIEPYSDGALPEWARDAGVPAFRPDPIDGTALAAQVDRRWAAAVAGAQPRLVPVAVSGATALAAALPASPDDPGEDGAARDDGGRFGPQFGSVVHTAIGRILRGRSERPADAVAAAARTHGLRDHLGEVEQDVTRALESLRAHGLLREGATRALEYPISGPTGDGRHVLVGLIDFVELSDTDTVVVDFKTDVPPGGDVRATYPEYVAQVQTYVRLLPAAGVGDERPPRCALLFTADGSWHDVSS